MSQFTFQIDAPFVSSEEYARRVGISVRAVRGLISDGRLPIRKKLKPNERPYINMLAIAKEAAEHAA
jgi:hypothetical protein